MALGVMYFSPMTIVFKPTSLPSTSLRGRQQDAVRSSIIEAGIALFLERGFDQTSVDMIAADAGLSRRTVFRHFPTKDEIVIAWSYAAADALAAAVHLRPANEPPLACLCAVLQEHVAAHADQLPAALAIGRLIAATPSLRARSAEKYTRWERVLTEALVRRAGADTGMIALAPVAAAVAVSVFRVGAQAWISGDGAEPLVNILADRFSALSTLQIQSSQP